MFVNTYTGNILWRTNKVYIVVLTIQIAVLALWRMDALNFTVPVLPQLIGFIYLTFIPGIIILHIFSLRVLGFLKMLLFSSALSIAFLMIIGLFANAVYSYLGISTPLSLTSLIITISVLTIALGFIAYLKDRRRPPQPESIRGKIPVPPASVLFLILLPLLSILGTQLVNNYNNNIVLLIMLGLVGIIPVLVTFSNSIPESLHPLAIVSIAFSLVYHIGLISNYIVGFDIHTEYQLANLVLINAHWEPNITQTYNSSLCVTILPSIYAHICQLSLTWVFKVLYPIFLVISALFTYEIGSTLTHNSKIGFLSAFFMMAINVFYFVLPEVAKQEVAYLFMGAIILLILDKSNHPIPKRIMAMVLVTGLIVSHYSMAIIFLGAAIFVQLSLFILNRFPELNPTKHVPIGPSSLNGANNRLSVNIDSTDIVGDLTFVIFTFLIAISWYIVQSGGMVFNGAVFIIRDIIANMSEMFNPKTSEALWVITAGTDSPIHDTLKYIHLFTQLLIGIGIIDIFLHWRRRILDRTYSLFSLAYFILLIAALVLPYVASSILTTRLYHITLLLLAPLCIYGCISIFRILLFNKTKIIDTEKLALRFISLVLTLFLLLNTGFVFEILHDHPSSIALSKESVVKFNDEDEVSYFYNNYTAKQEVYSAMWFSINTANDSQVYANTWGGYEVHSLISYGMVPFSRMYHLNVSLNQLYPGRYVYLGYANTVFGLASKQAKKTGSGVTLISGRTEFLPANMKEFDQLLTGLDKTYSNGGSEILFVPVDKR